MNNLFRDYWFNFFNTSDKYLNSYLLLKKLNNGFNDSVRHGCRVARNYLKLAQNQNFDFVQVALFHEYSMDEDDLEFICGRIPDEIYSMLKKLFELDFEFDDYPDGYELNQNVFIAFDEEAELLHDLKGLGDDFVLLKIAHRIEALDQLREAIYASRDMKTSLGRENLVKAKYLMANTRKLYIKYAKDNLSAFAHDLLKGAYKRTYALISREFNNFPRGNVKNNKRTMYATN